MSLILDLLTTVDTQVNHYIFDGYRAVVGIFATTFTTLLIIYFAGLGWMFIRGLLPVTPMAVGWHMLKAAFIFAFALNWNYFSYFFVNFFVHGTDRLVSIVLTTGGNGSDPKTVTQALAGVWDTGSAVFANVWRLSGSDFLLGTLMGFVGYAAITGITAMALFYIVMSKIALAVLMILAPIMLPLFLWQSTRGIFNSWLRLLVQWMFTPLFIYAFIGLYLQLIQGQIQAMAAAPGGPTTGSIMAFALLAVIVMATFKQASNMSRDLASKLALGDAGGSGESMPALALKSWRQNKG